LRKIPVIGIVMVLISACSPKPVPVLPAQQQFELAKKYYNNKKYHKALPEFEKLIYAYPGNIVIDSAQFFLAMCYYNQKDYPEAIGEYKRLLQSYPQSEFADDSQYYLACCHFKMSPKYQLDQSETYLAIEAFQLLLSNYPVSPFNDDARHKLAELDSKLAQKKFMTGILYLKNGDYQPALLYFWNVRDNHPATPWAIEAIYYTGEAQIRMGSKSEGIQTLKAFADGFPNHKLAAKARRMLEKLRNDSSVAG